MCVKFLSVGTLKILDILREMFPAPTRFLIVDDSENIRELLKRELAELGFNGMIKEAASADDAVQILVNQSQTPEPFDCVISDWNMPGTSGLDFLKAIRKNAAFQKLPFLLVTSEANPEQVLEAAAAGVSNYIVKPFSTDTLKEKLKAVWKKHNPGS